MFLCQPQLDVLIARAVEDIHTFIQPQSWNDRPDPESIPGMTDDADRVMAAVRDQQRIAIFGDCDGILGAHILRPVPANSLYAMCRHPWQSWNSGVFRHSQLQ